MPAREGGGPRRRPRILVAGLGNLLLRDDGVGVHAVRALRNRVPRGVRVVEVGTAILDALHLFEWADTVLALDAMQAGGTPGSIYQFGMGDVADHPVPTSLHELDLRAALGFLLIPPSPTIVVLGVEPEIIDAGLTLSSSVQAALPRLVTAASSLAARWSAGAQVEYRRADPGWREGSPSLLAGE